MLPTVRLVALPMRSLPNADMVCADAIRLDLPSVQQRLRANDNRVPSLQPADQDRGDVLMRDRTFNTIMWGCLVAQIICVAINLGLLYLRIN